METEMNRMSVNVFGHEFEVHVPKGKEQLYLSAAEFVNKKIDTYMDAYVRISLPQKSTQEILLMAMLDIAVDSIECKQSNENWTYGSFCRIECAPIPYKRRHSERFKVLSCKIELFNASIGHFAG